MTISAIMIADSVSEFGDRLTTLQLRYPRFIHAEFMTHRAFSRNASSSRAIPVQRLIQDVIDDTAMPLHWGKNQPGMQAREEHNSRIKLTVPTFYDGEYVGDSEHLYSTVEAWKFARDRAIEIARAFDAAGYHKQIVNRLLEPFSHINVVVSATDWDNFFTLRDHPDAQPEIQVLARAIKDAMTASEPHPIGEDEWHLPYVSAAEEAALGPDSIKVSVARCARVSYVTHDGRRTTAEEDIALHDKLVVAEPLHASPAEHQATPARGRHRNFHGWKQYRTLLEDVA